MNPNTIVGAHKEPSTLVRPEYGPGLLLNDDDLRQAVDYTRDLNRLIFRALLGCGVICGFKVSTEFECGHLVVKIEKGVALDCHGDPVNLTAAASIVIDPSCGADLPTKLWVLVRRYQRACAPRGTVCCPDDDDDAHSVSTRIRDGIEIVIVKDKPECACGCPESETPAAAATNAKAVKRASAAAAADGNQEPGECYKPHVEGKCNCDCGDGADSEWIILARLDLTDPKNNGWTSEHGVRRFIRPRLLDDPLRTPANQSEAKK